MTTSYGEPRPQCKAGADWLRDFMLKHHLSQEMVGLVLGLNQARIWEWRNGHLLLPAEAKQALQDWVDQGRPQFAFWGRVPRQRPAARQFRQPGFWDDGREEY